MSVATGTMASSRIDPLAGDAAKAAPASDTVSLFARLLADVLHVEQVAPESDFFSDLGADSMTMAHFCARVRKQPDLPSVSMRDVYRHPTIGALAAALEGADGAGEASVETAARAMTQPAAQGARSADRAGTLGYVLCGALQLLAALVYAYVFAVLIALAATWIIGASGPVDAYVRTVVAGGAVFVVLSIIPIVAKWALIGRWQAQSIRIWSLAYVRFWIVKWLVQRSPLVLFVGSPLYTLYLRALGAKVGRDVVILSTWVPVCTDLLTIGDGSVIRKDTFFLGYRAVDGVIETGPVSLGRDVVVGESVVLDIGTSMGDRSQLGHASSLQVGQALPAGERRQGFAAQARAEVDFRGVEPLPASGLRPALYALLQLTWVLGIVAPLLVGLLALLMALVPSLGSLLGAGPPALAGLDFFRDALVVSLVLFFGSLLVGLLFVVTVPRLLALAIRADTTYPLYGFHYALHRAIERLTNVPYFVHLFGDSSYVVHYLRALGYDLSRVEQTGSNFGLEVKHESPFLSTVGTGTMAADGLSIVNADYSSTSFRLSRTTIGRHSFLGNYVVYPSQATVVDDRLLATKVLVPTEADARPGIGLLGSPSFEIPRRVERDGRFEHLRTGAELRRRLRAKDLHNAVTIGLFLLEQWLFAFGMTVILAAALSLYPTFGAGAFAVATLLGVGFGVAWFAFVERASTAFRRLRPRLCSIYDPYFWWHERFWKLATQPLVLDGTPFKGLAWRLLGVRIGKRVYDDGCRIVEKTLATIGDDCTLGSRSIIQPHSQEEGAFKSDRIAIGAGCTLGIGSVVHYGVTMGDGAQLAPDSFLMKGEQVGAATFWAGNPAREIRVDGPDALSAAMGASR